MLQEKVNYKFLDARMNLVKKEVIAVSMHRIIISHVELGGDIDDF